MEAQFVKIIKGTMSYQSANLGLNLLITRLKKKYSAHPTTEVLGTCIEELNQFFVKYDRILVADIENLKTI